MKLFAQTAERLRAHTTWRNDQIHIMDNPFLERNYTAVLELEIIGARRGAALLNFVCIRTGTLTSTYRYRQGFS
jgi:hypothetical protein